MLPAPTLQAPPAQLPWLRIAQIVLLWALFFGFQASRRVICALRPPRCPKGNLSPVGLACILRPACACSNRESLAWLLRPCLPHRLARSDTPGAAGRPA